MKEILIVGGGNLVHNLRDYFTKTRTLTGVYNYDQNAIDFGNMNLEQRIKLAHEGAVKFQPDLLVVVNFA